MLDEENILHRLVEVATRSTMFADIILNKSQVYTITYCHLWLPGGGSTDTQVRLNGINKKLKSVANKHGYVEEFI